MHGCDIEPRRNCYNGHDKDIPHKKSLPMLIKHKSDVGVFLNLKGLVLKVKQ